MPNNPSLSPARAAKQTKFRKFVPPVVIGALIVGSAVGGTAVLSSTPTNGFAQNSSSVTKTTHSPAPTAAPTTVAPLSTVSRCSGKVTSVTTAAQLIAALTAVKPGQTIGLAPVVYLGNFVATASGTAASPITLCGSPASVLDGNNINKGYVFHLDGASNWILDGFSVRGGQKGVVADGTNHSDIEHLTVSGIGDEGIHLRKFSSDNLIQDNTVTDTGKLRAKFGEGIYIGTAVKNWPSITGGLPDRSDRNIIKANTISNNTAEEIDIKEGTTGGKIINNTFNGAGMTAAGASSWVNVKGNNWDIDGNTGTSSLQDGFSTHQILPGWGTNNTFEGNTANVNGPGFGYHFTPVNNNRVLVGDTETGAKLGISNVPLTAG